MLVNFLAYNAPVPSLTKALRSCFVYCASRIGHIAAVPVSEINTCVPCERRRYGEVIGHRRLDCCDWIQQQQQLLHVTHTSLKTRRSVQRCILVSLTPASHHNDEAPTAAGTSRFWGPQNSWAEKFFFRIFGDVLVEKQSAIGAYCVYL